ncbi:MAG: hypothetical protein JW893_00430 [Candidatus Omnitrophica bacterium]|nr:hypothetical protein [Candidatus Omnitrophota bacterium]
MNRNKSLSIFIFFFALFLLTHHGFDKSEGGGQYWLAENILRNGSLSYPLSEATFQPSYSSAIPDLNSGREISIKERTGTIAFNSNPAILTPNGRVYLAHEIGQTLVMLPVAWWNWGIEILMQRRGFNPWTIYRTKIFFYSLMGALYGALAAFLFYRVLRTGFGQSHLGSFSATLLLCLTTYCWSYTRYLFEGVLQGVFFLFSYSMLLRFREKRKGRFLFWVFLGLGFSLITRVTSILAISVFLFYLMRLSYPSKTERLKVLLSAVIILVPFGVWQAWYNWIRTGFFYLSPLMTEGISEGKGRFLGGLPGLLFSPGMSLFVFAPLLLFSVYFFPRFYRRFKWDGECVFLLAILWFGLHSSIKLWHGAASWGPRYFIAILPFLFLPVAVSLREIMKRTVLRLSAMSLGAWGFLLNLSSIISDWHFRVACANARGKLDQSWLWDFWKAQPADMFRGAYENVVRLMTHAPPRILENYSQADLWPVNTINIWPFAVVYAGVPVWMTVIAVVFLMGVLFIALRKILTPPPRR